MFIEHKYMRCLVVIWCMFHMDFLIDDMDMCRFLSSSIFLCAFGTSDSYNFCSYWIDLPTLCTIFFNERVIFVSLDWMA